MDNANESKNFDLQFKNKNPGAVQYGNFINYYQFHPPENRLKLFPTNIWEDKDVFIGLDIGCNAGDLTLELYNFLKSKVYRNVKMLGIDIDDVLILRSNEKTNNDVHFQHCDFMDTNKSAEILTNYLKQFSISRFHASFCFSITMWIHLNHGDSGLNQFLKRVCDISDLIVIEPQPWNCYKSAVKRTKKEFEFKFFKSLKIRENVETEIEKVIEGYDFIKILETPKTEWGRRLMFFKRKS